MSELKIMSPQGQYLNICDSEWYQRQDDDTWLLIDPLNDVRVRHGSNQYWLPILCNEDVAYCPPEALQKCWPGHTGNFDGGEFKTGGTTGYLVCDCNGSNCKTYTGHTPDYNIAGGRFYATSPIESTTIANRLPVTLFGSVAQISEMLVYAGVESGFITVSIDALDPGIRVRVYNDCELLGDSAKSGAHFNVFFDAAPLKATEKDCGEEQPANNFLTIRVDSPGNARWRVKLGEVGVEQASHYQRPAPCFGTFKPRAPCLVSDNDVKIPGNYVYEMVHAIPANGTIRLDLSVQGTGAVKVSAIYNSTVLSTVTSANSTAVLFDTKNLTFGFNAVGGDNKLIIRYECEREADDWYYTIYCPDQKGARTFPQTCKGLPDDTLCSPQGAITPAFATTGKGAILNDVYIDMGGAARGEVVFEYSASDLVQFLVYQGPYPKETMIGGTKGFVSGTRRFVVMFDPSLGQLLHVRIKGSCCPDWTFTASCPIMPAKLSIHNASRARGAKGSIYQMCFDIDVNHVVNKDITFDWTTTPLTALESPDGSCTMGVVPPSSPYCNISAEAGAANRGLSPIDVGHPATQMVYTPLHDPDCAVGGQYYVLETEIDIPATGDYIITGCADDNLTVLLDCQQIHYSTLDQLAVSTQFSATAGRKTISAMYQNIPNCTPGYMMFTIRNTAGFVIFYTDANIGTWRSKAGTISIEPPAPVDPTPADYNKSGGTVTLPACSPSTRVCVPICGTNLMGPDVTFQVTLSNLRNVEAGQLTAIGTIGNDNFYSCEQNTAISVLDRGPDGNVNRGARGMYVNKLMANAGAAYVMDTRINLSVSGLYSFVFFGADSAELIVDCQPFATSARNVVQVKQQLNAGEHHVIINYYVNAGGAKREGYAALAVIDPMNQVAYVSNAADWRGRVIQAGSPPMCDQFPRQCGVVPMGNAILLPEMGDAGTGYGAQTIQSSLHPVGCAPANTFYTFEQMMNFPVSGTYTFHGIADDTLDIYIDCVNVFSNPNLTLHTTRANVTAGQRLVTFSYKNIPECTPGVASFAILAPDGSVFYATRPDGWISNVGTLTSPLPLGETFQDRYGYWTVHLGNSIYGTGTDYAWWSAELDWNSPGEGTYFAMGAADDEMELFVGCQRQSLNGAPFTIDSGTVKIHVRVYNRRARDENWFHFKLYRADGSLVYESRAAGWRAKRTDLDFTGLT